VISWHRLPAGGNYGRDARAASRPGLAAGDKFCVMSAETVTGSRAGHCVFGMSPVDLPFCQRKVVGGGIGNSEK